MQAGRSDLDGWRGRVGGLDEAIRRFDWRTVIADYDDRLETLAAGTDRDITSGTTGGPD